MFHSAQLTLPRIRVVTSSRIYRAAAARRLSYREVKPKSLEAEFMILRQKIKLILTYYPPPQQPHILSGTLEK
jgi:hypothetical protein